MLAHDYISAPRGYRTRKGFRLWAAYNALERTVGPTALNLATAEAKLAVWKARDRTLELLTHEVRPHFVAQFQAERRAIREALADAQPFHAHVRAVAALESVEHNWTLALAKAYMAAIPKAARRQWADFRRAAFAKSIRATATLLQVRKAEDDPWMGEALRWVRENGGDEIKQITDTTREQVRRVLSLGLEAGDDIAGLIKRVDSLYLDQIIAHRSEVIARTEAHVAAGVGSRAAAKQTGLPLDKEWYNAQDSRVRGLKPEDEFDHVKAHGQRVDFDLPYVVTGESLMFPGDGSRGASAGNIIQCRCTELYHTKEA